MAAQEVRVPDIGEFADVPIIEIHVAPGDTVAVDDPLLTLESDKATLDVPSPVAGTVSSLAVSVGDTVSEGSVIGVVETAGAAAAGGAPPKEHVRESAHPESGEVASYGSSAGVYDHVEVTVPEIGDFSDVPVIEIHVAAGDTVSAEDPLITLESDKATMDVPAPTAGTVIAVQVSVGDTVSVGSHIVELSTGQDTRAAAGASAGPPAAATAPAGYGSSAAPPSGHDRVTSGMGGAPAPYTGEKGDQHAEVLVLGAGPGGYTAAFRAADLGRKVVMVDSRGPLGGVCLNVGCIPSKALLHAAKVIAETKEMSAHGLSFASPTIDLDALRGWKDQVVQRLTGGLVGLAKQRKVTTMVGTGTFTGPNMLSVAGPDGTTSTVSFDAAIIAAGSEPVQLPFVPHDDPRVIDSTGALDLTDIPERLLILGGGIIGLEMATVYSELGTRISVVELMDQLIPGADKDLVTPLTRRIAKDYDAIWVSTKVTAVEAGPDGLTVSFEGGKAPASAVFDEVLVAVGRRPNGKLIGADAAGVFVDERGFVPVDKQQRTNVGHIFAIGDVVGQPMLAHKATHEGKVAAENTAGHTRYFDATVIPSVAYTDPEVAWVGVTENEARAAGVRYGKGVFPWMASGRSLSLGRDEGMTKVLFDESSDRIIGAGIVGPNAGDLIAEAALAIEMGSDAADIGLTIHPHPTLSETVAMAAEAFEGTITDLYLPKKK
jgi:dihydrolipoamide dehydrogenase